MNYSRKAYFYEMDLMGVMHHANHWRLFEESREAWLREHKLERYHGKEANCLFAVVGARIQYRRPIVYGDAVTVNLQTKLDGNQIIFQYQVFTEKHSTPVVLAESVHVPVCAEMKVIKLPKAIREVLKEAPWKETWL